MQTNVLEYLEQTAPRVPDKVAYGNEDTEVTFGEVLRNAQAIGTFLKRQGHYKEPVVVFMRKHPNAIISFYGAVYAGCFYAGYSGKSENCHHEKYCAKGGYFLKNLFHMLHLA